MYSNNLFTGGSSFGSSMINGGSSALVNSGGSSSGGLGAVLGGFNFGSILGSLSGLFSNIRCWGSSWTPSKAENYVQNHITNTVQALQIALSGANYDNLEQVNNILYAYKEDYIDEASWIRTSSPGKCSKDSITAMLPPLDSAFNQMVLSVKQAYETEAKPVETFTKPLTKRMLTWNVTQYRKKESIISNPINAINNGVKTLSSGLLLPLVMLGTLIMWGAKALKNSNNLKR